MVRDKDKENNLERSERKMTLHIQGNSNKISGDFSSEIMLAMK